MGGGAYSYLHTHTAGVLYGEGGKLLSPSGLVHLSCKKDADGISGVFAGGEGAGVIPWFGYISQGLM